MSFENGGFAPAGSRSLVLVLHTLQHGSVLQHVWQDEEADLTPTDVDLLQLRHTAVTVRHCDVGHLRQKTQLTRGEPHCGEETTILYFIHSSSGNFVPCSSLKARGQKVELTT